MPRNRSKTIPPRVPDSPSTSGFSFFGIPLSGVSLNKILQAGVTRVENKKTPPTAERKNAIMNQPESDLPKRNRPMKHPGQVESQNSGSYNSRDNYPPTIPEFQSGFTPILPGSGGFKPIANPNLPPIQKQNTITQNNRKDFQESSPAEKPVNHTSSPVINETNKDPVLQTKSKSTSADTVTESPKKNKGTKIFESQTHTKSKLTVLEETEYRNNTPDGGGTVQSRKKMWSADNRHHNVSKLGDMDEITTTERYIAITTTKTTTERIIVAAANEEISSKITTTPLKQISTKQLQPNTSDKVLETGKSVATPLSTFLAPGSEISLLKNTAKSTITKVPSPHLESSQNSRSDVDVSLPLAHREDDSIFPLHADLETLAEKSNVDNNDWYFENYNKTDIKPFITTVTSSTRGNNLRILNYLISALLMLTFMCQKCHINIFI